jgi:hypothetical protein
LLVGWLEAHAEGDPPDLVVANPTYISPGQPGPGHIETIIRSAATADYYGRWTFDTGTPAAIIKSQATESRPERTLREADAAAAVLRQVLNVPDSARTGGRHIPVFDDLPAGRCLSAAPGMPTTNMARTVEHYGRLGFAFSAPASSSLAGAGFAIGRRDGIELHFALKQDHDPARTATWVYIRVEDADVMSEELTAAGAAQGRLVRTTDYNMRELAHIDPDGNPAAVRLAVAA